MQIVYTALHVCSRLLCFPVWTSSRCRLDEFARLWGDSSLLWGDSSFAEPICLLYPPADQRSMCTSSTLGFAGLVELAFFVLLPPPPPLLTLLLGRINSCGQFSESPTTPLYPNPKLINTDCSAGRGSMAFRLRCKAGLGANKPGDSCGEIGEVIGLSIFLPLLWLGCWALLCGLLCDNNLEIILDCCPGVTRRRLLIGPVYAWETKNGSIVEQLSASRTPPPVPTYSRSSEAVIVVIRLFRPVSRVQCHNKLKLIIITVSTSLIKSTAI